MAAASTECATLDDFLRAETAAPEGTRLALIYGEIVEWGANLTTRPVALNRVMAKLCFFFGHWMDDSELIGTPAAGEARCRLRTNPETIVGIDAGVWLGARFTDFTINDQYFDGPPTLAVDLVNPHESPDMIGFRLDQFLKSGVKRVWQIHPVARTIVVCRPDGTKQDLSGCDTLTGEEVLPGLVIPLVELLP